MGLDTVELVMSVEQEFDVVIQLDDYGELRTVGDLCEYIARQKRVETVCLHPAAFVRIRRALMNQFGLPRRQVRIATDLQRLFPVRQRRRLWALFESQLGLRIPSLQPSPDQRQIVESGTIVAAIAFALLSFQNPLFLIVALLTPMAGLILLAVIEAQFARTFAMPQATVGDLTRSVAVLNAGALSPEVRETAGDEVAIWPRLRRIVSRSLSIPEEEISPESRFVEDLLVD
jgi:acyl carrier protein